MAPNRDRRNSRITKEEDHEIEGDLLEIARKYWIDIDTAIPTAKLNASLVSTIFQRYKSDSESLATLEISCYLEKYLWPLFPTTDNAATSEHLLSIMMVCVQKQLLGLPVFAYLAEDPAKYTTFFEQSVHLLSLPLEEENLALYTQFFTYVFRTLEIAEVRKHCLKLVSLSLWENLSESRLKSELEASSTLASYWESYLASKASITATPVADTEPLSPSQPLKKRKKVGKKSAVPSSSEEPSTAAAVNAPSQEPIIFFHQLTTLFFTALDANTSSHYDAFIAHFCELVLDLLSQLPTRRFLNTYLDGEHYTKWPF